MIIQDGLQRMYAEQQDVYYLPDGDERKTTGIRRCPKAPAADIVKGMYLFRAGEPAKVKTPRVQLMRLGRTIFREVIAAADLLQNDWGNRRRPVELRELHRAGAREGS